MYICFIHYQQSTKRLKSLKCQNKTNRSKKCLIQAFGKVSLLDNFLTKKLSMSGVCRFDFANIQNCEKKTFGKKKSNQSIENWKELDEIRCIY